MNVNDIIKDRDARGIFALLMDVTDFVFNSNPSE
jgi:hypothetical protein